MCVFTGAKIAPRSGFGSPPNARLHLPGRLAFTCCQSRLNQPGMFIFAHSGLSDEKHLFSAGEAPFAFLFDTTGDSPVMHFA